MNHVPPPARFAMFREKSPMPPTCPRSNSKLVVVADQVAIRIAGADLLENPFLAWLGECAAGRPRWKVESGGSEGPSAAVGFGVRRSSQPRDTFSDPRTRNRSSFTPQQQGGFELRQGARTRTIQFGGLPLGATSVPCLDWPSSLAPSTNVPPLRLQPVASPAPRLPLRGAAGSTR